MISVEDELSRWEEERGLDSHQRTAVYVSAPITTGPTYLEWLSRDHSGNQNDPDRAVSFRAGVVLPNTQRVARFVELLRWKHVGLIIDPTSLEIPGWEQSSYHRFWLTILERHARRIVFLNGWQLSRGCTLEFETAQRLALDCVDEVFAPLSAERGLELIRSGIRQLEDLGADTKHFVDLADRIQVTTKSRTDTRRELFKDETLSRLSHTANVAQFVSFGPGEELVQRYCCIRGFEVDHTFDTADLAVRALMERCPEQKVNIRSFDPVQPEGNPFIRGLSDVAEVVARLKELSCGRGLYTIVNETINERDGGVSGVAYRGAIEFAPDANPRCVDDPDIDTAILPFELGMRLLGAVYGFEPDLRGREGARVEFSVHPGPRGWNATHTIIWQTEQRPASDLQVVLQWPNRFSRFLGDKAYGLAVAAVAGLPVPRTVVFSRRLFPFTFGRSTGSGRVWTRTCPETKAPGYYPTRRGWTDPYAVLKDWRVLQDRPEAANVESAETPALASVLVQEAVSATYSGSATGRDQDDVLIEGVAGEGDAFMVGDVGIVELPPHVVEEVRATYVLALNRLGVGSLRLEWVFDGSMVWIVQINAQPRVPAAATLDKNVQWIDYRFKKGELEFFRQRVMALQGQNKGVVVKGNVSPLSHLGEIAETYGVPTRFVGP